MPSKTKKRKTETKPKHKLILEDITPRAVRVGIAAGSILVIEKKTPKPPAEWRDWKRQNFQLSIDAGWLFLQGRELDQIKTSLKKSNVTRQRMAQMVKAGVRFLLDRGVVVRLP